MGSGCFRASYLLRLYIDTVSYDYCFFFFFKLEYIKSGVNWKRWENKKRRANESESYGIFVLQWCWSPAWFIRTQEIYPNRESGPLFGSGNSLALFKATSHFSKGEELKTSTNYLFQLVPFFAFCIFFIFSFSLNFPNILWWLIVS